MLRPSREGGIFQAGMHCSGSCWTHTPLIVKFHRLQQFWGIAYFGDCPPSLLLREQGLTGTPSSAGLSSGSEKHENNRHVLKCDFPENVGNCLYFSWGSETQLGVMAEEHWRKLPRSFCCGVVPVQGTESSLHGCDPEREGKSCHSCGMSYPAGWNAFFIAQDLDLSPPNSSVPGILTQLGTDCPAEGGAGSHVEL